MEIYKEKSISRRKFFEALLNNLDTNFIFDFSNLHYHQNLMMEELIIEDNCFMREN